MSLVSELNLKLLKRAPFLATVALHAEVVLEERPDVETAATDGKRIFLSPSQFMARPLQDKLFIYAHEVLHCAFSHVFRRGGREPRRWNIAADIVVNGVLAQSGLEPPEDALREKTLEVLSTEEVYEQLLNDPTSSKLQTDLLAPDGSDTACLKGQWQGVLRKAVTLSKMTDAGNLPLGHELEFALGKQQVDWREVLMRFLISTQEDYAGFDTRLIHRGIYVETLKSQGLTAAVHIDTSGSLNEAEMQGQFLAELKGILNAYPGGVEVNLTYGDTKLYGPFELTQATEIPAPQGGGGTSFIPFFESAEMSAPNIPLVIFTDGYGSFPAACDQPCLWIVPEGGLATDHFPFGEVTRLAS